MGLVNVRNLVVLLTSPALYRQRYSLLHLLQNPQPKNLKSRLEVSDSFLYLTLLANLVG